MSLESSLLPPSLPSEKVRALEYATPRSAPDVPGWQKLLSYGGIIVLGGFSVLVSPENKETLYQLARDYLQPAAIHSSQAAPFSQQSAITPAVPYTSLASPDSAYTAAIDSSYVGTPSQ